MNLFGLRPTVTLHDLADTCFEGEARGRPKARHGHSKERRGDCPLLTLGLVLDASGFARRSQVFAGNAAEATALEAMPKGLDAPDGALAVTDRGIATEERLQWLRERGCRCLAVSRKRRRGFEEDGAVTVENRKGQPVRLRGTVDEESGEARLQCGSAARAEKERGIAERFARQFEEGLQETSDGLKKSKTRKKVERARQRIGRLKERCKEAGRHYGIEGVKATAARWERKPAEGSMATHPGPYCLRSSVTDCDEETMRRTCTALTDVEAVFRSLKSERPKAPSNSFADSVQCVGRMRMLTVPAARHTHSQCRARPPLRSSIWTDQLVSSACATTAPSRRARIAKTSGSNSFPSPPKPRDSVPAGTRRPSAARSRTAADRGRKCAKTCTRNHAHTVTPKGEFGSRRGTGGATASLACSHWQAGRKPRRWISRRKASIRSSITWLVSAPCGL